MKYDMSKIMKDAWAITKKYGKKFSEALRMSWKLSKMIRELLTRDHAESYGNVRVNLWFNYGKARAYVERSWVSKYQNSKRFFIDLETGLFRQS